MIYKNLSSFIWVFVKKQRVKFFLLFFFSLAGAVETLSWPYLLGRFVDVLTRYDRERLLAWKELTPVLSLGIFFFVLIAIGFRSRSFIRVRFFPKLEADIRMTMFDHVQRHSPKYFNEHFSGSLANKISDMTTQVTAIFVALLFFFPIVVTCLVSLVIFFYFNVFFAMILLGWLVLSYLICVFFIPKTILRAKEHGHVRSRLIGKIVDSLANYLSVNIFFRFGFEKDRIFISQKEEQAKNTRAQGCVAWMFLFLSVNLLAGLFAITGVIVSFWLQDKITTGEAVQIFNTTFCVMSLVWWASETLSGFFQSIGIATQALTLMQDPQDIKDAPIAKELAIHKGEIVFENVSFQYGEAKLFMNKSLCIRGGEKVGLVGHSGAGKSTFISLILRFHKLDGGRILLDGQDIASVSLESLRKAIVLIPQDPLLFHRSLQENIQYGCLEASQEEVLLAAQKAHCDSFCEKCEKGYDSLVGERGTKLSGGERQRIAIARAFLTKAEVLILDEATSSLDSITEGVIQESLEELMATKTTIVIAHRLSTLAKMDRILVFHQGKIIEEGSHQELLSQNGHYASMWQMQSGGFLPA